MLREIKAAGFEVRFVIVVGRLRPESFDSARYALRPAEADLPQIIRTSRQHWSLNDARAFYAEHAGKPYVDRLIQHAISGPCLALGLIKHNAIADWREMIGPTHVYK